LKTFPSRLSFGVRASLGQPGLRRAEIYVLF
jgi:hypothetical protein